MSILHELLGEIPFRTFFEQHYLKLPCAGSATQHPWTQTIGWNAVERLMRHPEADLIVHRQGEKWPGGSPQPEQLPLLLAEGYTLGLRHVDQYDKDLSQLADQFREDFAAPIDIHLYCTPENQSGFDWHYDAEEVFVLQTLGSKQWWLRKNTVHPWPLIDTIPIDQRYERDNMPVMHCRLEEGDWLYIPAGYWHRTQAEQTSISLTVGIRAWTALDVYDALRSRLSESMLWRQRLPCFSNIAISSQDLSVLQKVLAMMADDISAYLSTTSSVQLLVNHLRQKSSESTHCSQHSSDGHWLKH